MPAVRAFLPGGILSHLHVKQIEASPALPGKDYQRQLMAQEALCTEVISMYISYKIGLAQSCSFFFFGFLPSKDCAQESLVGYISNSE